MNNIMSTLPRYTPLNMQHTALTAPSTGSTLIVKTIRNSIHTLSSICNTANVAANTLTRWAVKNPITASLAALTTLALGASLLGLKMEASLANNKNDETFNDTRCQELSTLQFGMNKGQYFSIHDLKSGHILAQLKQDEVTDNSEVFLDVSDFCAEDLMENSFMFQCNEEKLFEVKPRHLENFSEQIRKTACRQKTDFNDMFFGKLEKDQRITVRKQKNDDASRSDAVNENSSKSGDIDNNENIDGSGSSDFFFVDGED